MSAAVSESGASVNNDTVEEVEEKWIQHYSSLHKILLVGEGDFSFALCLATAFGSGKNIVATSLDSYLSVEYKYAGGMDNLRRLEELGCTILHGIDAYRMGSHRDLLGSKFDRIVFNFPHAGFLYPEHETFQIRRHQELVRAFFESASGMVREGGEVHVTHKTAYPYNQWDIEELAEESGLECFDDVFFHQFDYPGYKNKRGDGSRCDRKFKIGECFTFKFKVASVRGVSAQLQNLSI